MNYCATVVLHQVAALLCVLLLLPTIILASEHSDHGAAVSTTTLNASPNYPITKSPSRNSSTQVTSSYSSHPPFQANQEIQANFSPSVNISLDYPKTKSPINDPSTDVPSSYSSHEPPIETWENLHKIVQDNLWHPINDVSSDSYSNSLPNVLNVSSNSPNDLEKNATHQDISNILARFSLDVVQATVFAERMGLASSAELAERLGEVNIQGPGGPDDRPRALPLRSSRSNHPFPKTSKSGGMGRATKRLFFGDQSLCYTGTCEFFLVCWLGGGLIDGGCGGFLFACCNRGGVGGRTQNRPESYRDDSQGLVPRDYGPIRNDPSCGLSSSGSGRLGAQRRIVGGTEAGFGSFPWQAYIRIGSSRCGGSLVNKNYVITAGHCVARARPHQIRVTLGDYILNSDSEPLPSRVYGATDIKVHPRFKFTPSADRFDVAVIRLDIPVHFEPHVQPICLPEKGASWLGQYAWAAGWGALKAGSRLRPKTLQTVDVPILDSRQCEDWHKAKGINVIIYDEMMCAGYVNGDKDSCQGDSGGPLMMQEAGRWYLAGIVSAGYSCAERKQPGIYHKVAYTSDWISWAASGA